MRTVFVVPMIIVLVAPRFFDGGWAGMTDRQLFLATSMLSICAVGYCLGDYCSMLMDRWFK